MTLVNNFDNDFIFSILQNLSSSKLEANYWS